MRCEQACVPLDFNDSRHRAMVSALRFWNRLHRSVAGLLVLAGLSFCLPSVSMAQQSGGGSNTQGGPAPDVTIRPITPAEIQAIRTQYGIIDDAASRSLLQATVFGQISTQFDVVQLLRASPNGAFLGVAQAANGTVINCQIASVDMVPVTQAQANSINAPDLTVMGICFAKLTGAGSDVYSFGLVYRRGDTTSMMPLGLMTNVQSAQQLYLSMGMTCPNCQLPTCILDAQSQLEVNQVQPYKNAADKSALKLGVWGFILCGAGVLLSCPITPVIPSFCPGVRSESVMRGQFLRLYDRRRNWQSK